MNANEVCYILSLALQVAGAVLLIIKYLGKTRQRILEEYFPGSNIAKRDDSDMVTLEKDKVQDCVRRIYDNRMAFIFIAVGYILSIFGKIPYQSIECSLQVILATLVIIVIEKVISKKVSEVLYPEDMIINYKEVQDRADTNVTDREVDEMIDSIFK